MPTFDAPSPAPSRAARDAAHYAAQLVSAAGVTLLEPDPHFRYSSTTFDAKRAALVGAALPDGRRVSLGLADLVLSIGDGSMRLRGKPVADAASWLGAQLGATLRFPEWDMPHGPLLDRPAFEADDADLARLAHWYAAAHHTLAAFEAGQGQTSPIAVWPHHFDIAVLVTLRASPDDPEAATSVGIGMTPGDGGIAEPYLYLTPWPYPEARATPPLPAGRWNTEGWYGAVLDAADVGSQARVDAFVRAAFDHLAGALGF